MPPHLTTSPPTSPVRPGSSAATVTKSIERQIDEKDSAMKYSFYDSSSAPDESSGADAKENVDEREETPSNEHNANRFNFYDLAEEISPEEEEQDPAFPDKHVHQFYDAPAGDISSLTKENVDEREETSPTQDEEDVGQFFGAKEDDKKDPKEDPRDKDQEPTAGGESRPATKFSFYDSNSGPQAEKKEAVGEREEETAPSWEDDVDKQLFQMDEEDVGQFFGHLFREDAKEDVADKQEQPASFPKLHVHRFYQTSEEVKEQESELANSVHRFYQTSEALEEASFPKLHAESDIKEEVREQEPVPSNNKHVHQFYQTSEAPRSGGFSLDATSASTSYESNDETFEAEDEQNAKDGDEKVSLGGVLPELDAAIQKLVLAASASYEDVSASPSFESNVKKAIDTASNVDGSAKFSFYKSSIDILLRKEENAQDAKNEEHIQNNKNVHKFYQASKEPRNTYLELKDFEAPSSRRFHLSSMNASVTHNLELLRLYHEHKRMEGSLLDKYGFVTEPV